MQVNEIVMRGLLKPDRSTEPWWEMILFEDTTADKTHNAVLLRVHHTLADGIALVRSPSAFHDARHR